MVEKESMTVQILIGVLSYRKSYMPTNAAASELISGNRLLIQRFSIQGIDHRL